MMTIIFWNVSEDCFVFRSRDCFEHMESDLLHSQGSQQSSAALPALRDSAAASAVLMASAWETTMCLKMTELICTSALCLQGSVTRCISADHSN